MPINTVIREKRKELGLTQEQVAEHLGVSIPAVSKWESGATYPDITLLPALARLLKADPNTLLCFHEEPSQQEIFRFCSEISQILKEKEAAEGLEESCRFMKQKISEYPHCINLIHTFALTLDGALLMSTLSPAERKPYEELILSWYQRVLESNEESMRTRSAYMLASKYMQQNEYEKAQEMIDLLPDYNILDKKVMQAELHLNQKEHLTEAEELTQKKLLSTVMDLNGTLNRLVRILLAAGNTEKALQISAISEKAAELLGLGEYFTYITPLEIALTKEDAPECVRLIQSLLDTSRYLWNLKGCPLYDQIADSLDSGAQVSSRILPPFLARLGQEPRYAFLHDCEEFQALLKKYQTSL